VEHGLVADRRQPGSDEGATVGGDTGTAAREGKALEGEASEGTLQTDHPERGGTAGAATR
jgi:hypothetical protein